MSFRRAATLAVCLALAGVPSTLLATGSPPGPALAIRGVTLIDGTGEPPRSATTVIVRGERIVAVGPDREVPVPDGAEIVPGEGRFLLPGFVDTHAHLTMGPVGVAEVDGKPTLSMEPADGIEERTLATLLAFGVTSVRDPGGPGERTVAAREAVARGELTGPRAVVAGEVIDRAPFPGLVTTVASKGEVRSEVRRQAALGVDLVKVYVSLGPELIAAAVEEAHDHDLPVVGHLQATTWAEAAQMGIDGIVHVTPGSAELLPPDAREAYAASPGALAFPAWFDLVDLESDVVRRNVRALVEHGVSLDLTLVAFEAAFFGDRPRFTSEAPGLQLAHPALRENWASFFNFNVGWTEETFRTAHRVWPKVLHFTRMLWEAGVHLSAGTDANNPYVVPGESLHRELELLVAAGIPPAEVLRIATRDGAEAAGLLGETGTVEPGKRADLVLLEADPLEAIDNTRKIVWVMKDGRRFDPETLLEGLAR